MPCVEHGKSHKEKNTRNLLCVLSENGCYIKVKLIALRESCIFFAVFFVFHLAFLLELHLPARQSVKKLQCTEEDHLTTTNVSRLSDGVCTLERINCENVSFHRLQNPT